MKQCINHSCPIWKAGQFDENRPVCKTCPQCVEAGGDMFQYLKDIVGGKKK